MLLFNAVLAQAVFVLREPDDFGLIQNSTRLFFGTDMVLNFLQQHSLENAEIDCLMHTIYVDSPPFVDLSNVTIRNCVFKVRGGFASTFTDSRVVNTTFESADYVPLIDVASGSLFHGVASVIGGYFVRNITDVIIVGCAFRARCDAGSDTAGLFYRVERSRVQHSYFDVEIVFENSKLAAGLAIQSVNVSFFGVRAIFNVSATQIYSGTKVSGFVAEAGSGIVVDDSDFVITLRVSHVYKDIAGILATAGEPGVNLSNISVSGSISVGQFDTKGQYNSSGNICGILSSPSSSSADLSAISVFLDILRTGDLLTSTSSIAGVIAKPFLTKVLIQNCHVFGTFAVTESNTKYVYFAGLATCLTGNSTIYASTFCGTLSYAMLNGSTLYMGALGANLQKATLNYSSAVCDMHLESYYLNSTFLAPVAALIDNGFIIGCIVNATLDTQFKARAANAKISGLAVEIAKSVQIRNSTAVCNISIDASSNRVNSVTIALLLAGLRGQVMNCQVSGNIVFETNEPSLATSYIAGIAAEMSSANLVANITCAGSITMTAKNFNVATGFADVGSMTKIESVLIAINFIGQTDVNVFYEDIESTPVSNLFVDCSLTGNNASQEYCRTDPKSQATADALGAAFGWKMEYNDGYPYLVNLPVYDGTKYVLPASGPFSEDFYYVDGLGYPFPSSDYQICRGACYGTYESPLVRNCTNTTNNNSYCIQPELAETDFQTASCSQENAHCNSGASTCTSESELKLNQTDSTYSCELGCPGCVNGHCQNNTCVCNLYHSGDHCSTYQCGSDSPACFGDPTMQCAADGSGCVPTDACAALGCVHGSCVVNSSNKTQCRCDNMWTGSRCDRCNAYGPECSVSYLECNRLCGAHGLCGTPLTTICTCSLGFGGANCGGCAASHTAVGDKCVCGDSGGPCQLRQTCVNGVCVADCLLADPYCAECEAADQSVCARCVKQHAIQNGICQFHLSAAVSTSFAVVLGVAAAVAAALGAVLLFRLLSAKKNGNKQKPVGDGVKLDAVQSGPKSVGKAEKPLLEQVPAIQDVNIVLENNQAYLDK